MLTKISQLAIPRRALCIALASCLALASGSATADKIYKTVDKDGNVAYTDVAPKDRSSAIEISTGNNYTPPTTDTPVAATPPQTSEDGDEAGARYTGISIVSPGNDAAVRENSGNLSVALQIEPNYDSASGHIVQLIMDGSLVQSGPSTSFTLSNIDRGTHILTAQLVDTQGQVLAATPPTTFHMQRRSVLLQPKKPVKPQNPR
jgi:hypothetical protein